MLLILFENLKQINELFVHHPFFKVRIVAIFDLVVGSAFDIFGHLTPLTVMFIVQMHNQQVLLQGPLPLDNSRVEMVVPALPTLLANAPRQK